MPRSFTEYNSPACREFRERVNGINLQQISMLTAPQFEQLCARLDLEPGERVLDVGSGWGGIAAEIAKRSGAKITGIDKDEEVVAAANRQFHGVHFLEMDFDALSFADQSFDAIYAVDTLYFTEDLPGLIAKLERLLKPGGRFVGFWSQVLKEGADLERLKPTKTDLAVALGQLGCPYQFHDYTDQECAFWREASRVFEELKEVLIAEADPRWIEGVSAEIPIQIEVIESGGISRFAYWYQKS